MKPTEEKIHTDPSDLPIYLFKQGNNCEAYRYFGAHIETRAGESGVVFRVWAPHAAAISVVGDFNSWKPGSHPMHKVDQDSVWELFIPGMQSGSAGDPEAWPAFDRTFCRWPRSGRDSRSALLQWAGKARLPWRRRKSSPPGSCRLPAP